MCCVQTFTAKSKSNEHTVTETEALKRTAAAQDVRRNILENSEDFDARVCPYNNNLATHSMLLGLTMLWILPDLQFCVNRSSCLTSG